MTKKIVAIGGGENGRKKGDIYLPYETEIIDKEIVKLANKQQPNFLFLGHASPSEEVEKSYFEPIAKNFSELGCNCKILYSSDLYQDFEKAQQLVDWADIIYEGGGNTYKLIKTWKETNFYKILKEAYMNGKVLTGISAGAMCWFSLSNTLDLIKEEQNIVEGFGLFDAYFSPHSDVEGKLESVKRTLATIDKIGISLSNCCALEIVDDQYKIIKADASNYGIEAFCKKSYWENGEYLEEDVLESDELKPIDQLLSKNINKNVERIK